MISPTFGYLVAKPTRPILPIELRPKNPPSHPYFPCYIKLLHRRLIEGYIEVEYQSCIISIEDQEIIQA